MRKGRGQERGARGVEDVQSGRPGRRGEGGRDRNSTLTWFKKNRGLAPGGKELKESGRQSSDVVGRYWSRRCFAGRGMYPASTSVHA